jgi:hypothetical protein
MPTTYTQKCSIGNRALQQVDGLATIENYANPVTQNAFLMEKKAWSCKVP